MLEVADLNITVTFSARGESRKFRERSVAPPFYARFRNEWETVVGR